MKLSTQVRKLEQQHEELGKSIANRIRFIDTYPGGFRVKGEVIYGSDVYPLISNGEFVDETLNSLIPKSNAISAQLCEIRRLINRVQLETA